MVYSDVVKNKGDKINVFFLYVRFSLPKSAPILRLSVSMLIMWI